MTTPNWQHHSHKPKKTKGMCKGQLKARKQSLKALKAKFNLQQCLATQYSVGMPFSLEMVACLTVGCMGECPTSSQALSKLKNRQDQDKQG